jgi:hypothetical protein
MSLEDLGLIENHLFQNKKAHGKILHAPKKHPKTGDFLHIKPSGTACSEVRVETLLLFPR